MKKRLTDNFWMKLLSLGLAVMLWLIIKLSANLSYTYPKPESEPESPAVETTPAPKGIPGSAQKP